MTEKEENERAGDVGLEQSGDESDTYEMALDTLDEDDELYKSIMVALQEDSEADDDDKEADVLDLKGGERSDDTKDKGGERSDDTKEKGGEISDDTKEILVSEDYAHNGDKVPLLLEEASKESTRSSESSTERSDETTESDRSSWEKLE